MRTPYLVAVALMLLLTACDPATPITPEQHQMETERSKQAAKLLAEAWEMAERNDPAGFLKLLEIASDDTYPVEYSEVAYDDLSLLLYTRTETWIKAFANQDHKKFRERFRDIFYGGINPALLPAEATTEVRFYEGILSRLKQIKGTRKEMELAAYLQGLAEINIKLSREN